MNRRTRRGHEQGRSASPQLQPERKLPPANRPIPTINCPYCGHEFTDRCQILVTPGGNALIILLRCLRCEGQLAPLPPPSGKDGKQLWTPGMA